MTDELHISSIVVHCWPDHAEALSRQILAMNCEIAPTETTPESPSGRLIVLVERSTVRQVADVLDTLQALPGVLSALLVYHHAEPVTALEDLMP